MQSRRRSCAAGNLVAFDTLTDETVPNRVFAKLLAPRQLDSIALRVGRLLGRYPVPPTRAALYSSWRRIQNSVESPSSRPLGTRSSSG